MAISIKVKYVPSRRTTGVSSPHKSTGHFSFALMRIFCFFFLPHFFPSFFSHRSIWYGWTGLYHPAASVSPSRLLLRHKWTSSCVSAGFHGVTSPRLRHCVSHLGRVAPCAARPGDQHNGSERELDALTCGAFSPPTRGEDHLYWYAIGKSFIWVTIISLHGVRMQVWRTDAIG